MANKKKLRILIAGGGTGGHLFPGIAIAEEFAKQRKTEIRFVGTNRGIEVKVVPEHGYHLYTLPIQGLYRVGLAKKLVSLVKLPFAMVEAAGILLSFRPHLVVGVGGYASGPMLLVSLLFQKRCVLQEQNAYPGMTNRLLGKYVPLSFVPFTGLERVFKRPEVVGNPIRKAILNLSQEHDSREQEPFTLTIIGGSQGARILNNAMMELLPYLAELEKPIRVIHQTGKGDYERVREAYQKHPSIDADVQPFFKEMAEVYRQSHLLLSRAGSMVNEITAAGRASILVPIAISSGNHQLENAKKLVNAGAAVMIEESDLTLEKLHQSILFLVDNPEHRVAMEKAARKLFPGDSASLIVSRTLEFYRL